MASNRERLNLPSPSYPTTLSLLLNKEITLPNMENIASMTPAVYSVPTHVAAILDFDPNKGTPESKAQSLILSKHPSHNIISLYGEGGVGKTTILQALAVQPEIRHAFPDGIYMIELGQNAKLEVLQRKLVTFVRKVCGTQFLHEFRTDILDEYAEEDAVIGLVQELAEQQFLIIFDDVCKFDSRISKLINRISTEVQNLAHPTLKLLISTRSKDISNDFQAIEVKSLENNSEMCRRVFCKYAGLDSSSINNLCPSDLQAFQFVLGKCSGLPLALAVAGKALKGVLQREDTHGVSAWVSFMKELKVNIEILGGGCKHHHGLLSSLTFNLHNLQLDWKRDIESAERVFQSLCILDKQMTIPVESLARMWGMSPGDANTAARVLEDNSLVTIVHVGAGEEGGSWRGLRMHDIMNDMSAYLAGEKGMIEWHSRLLDSYASEAGSSCEPGESVPWWEVRSPGEYMRDNVVRHMVRCGRREDALKLLTDYRWIQKMNGVKNAVPFQSVISGLKLLREYVKGDSIACDIDVIISTMMKCLVPYCLENRRECSFQLYGRLVSLGSKSMIAKRLMWSIVRYASRPWVRASAEVLESADSELKRVLPVWFKSECMEWGIGSDDLIVGGKDGNMKCINCIDGTIQNTFSGHEKWIMGLCVDIEAGFIYSCSGDGTVIQWKNKEVERKFQVSLLEEEEVRCMTLLEKRGSVVIGTSKGWMIIVDIGSGEVIKTTEARTERISCLTVAKGGDLLVSGSWDDSIRVWDSKSLEAVGDALLGHTNDVRCVAVNCDDRMIASGSNDGTVRIWDFEERKELCLPLTAHEHSIFSVTFSRDGRQLFSGSWEDICVWDTSSVKDGVSLIRKLEDDRMSYVRSLRLRSDESELYALNQFGGICVWRLNGALEGSKDVTNLNYLKNISKFSMSQDDKLIVTLKKDERRIDVRRVEDVHLGSDVSIASFHLPKNISIYYDDGLSVSNDGKFVAYSSRRDRIVHIFETKNGKIVFRFEELKLWWKSFKESNSQPHVRYIDLNFDANVTSLTAQLHYYLEEEQPTHTVSWNLSTGEGLDTSCPVPPAAHGNSSTADGERNTTARLFCERDLDGEYAESVLYLTECDIFTIATLDVTPFATAYCKHRNLFLYLTGKGELQFAELILPETQLQHSDPPPLPIIPQSSLPTNNLPISTPNEAPNLKKFTVFISHAGPDKKTFAEKIYAGLKELDIEAFLDKRELHPGDEAPAKMRYAMENADIFVIILSPEFPARKWTVMELMCALRRYDEAKKNGLAGPVIIPIFYRLSIRECKSSKLFEEIEKYRNKFLTDEGFWERAYKNDLSITDISNAIGRLTSFSGLENDENATNEGDEGKRDRFAGWVIDVVEVFVEKIANAIGRLPSFTGLENVEEATNEGKRNLFAGRVVEAVKVAVEKIGKQSSSVGGSSSRN